MSQVSLTLIIPTYLRPERLQECLNSVIASGLCPQAVIVGVDGHDAATVTVLNDFESQLPIRYLPPEGENSSILGNLQRLIQEVSTEWVALIHDDDRLEMGASRLNSILEEFKPDFLFSDHWVISDAGRRLFHETEMNSLRYGRRSLIEGWQADPVMLGLKQSICLDGFIVRTSIAKKISISPEYGSTGDWLWQIRLLQKCQSVYYLNERRFSYRLSEDGMTGQGFDRSLVWKSFVALDDLKGEHQVVLENKIRLLAPVCAWDYLKKREFVIAREVMRHRAVRNHQKSVAAHLINLFLILPSSLQKLILAAIKFLRFQ